MKAIKMRIQKFSRPGVILMAIVVVIITSMVAANATQTITTPNAVKITYNLAAGANSAAITPATNTSVLVMGCCNSGGVGVGHASLLVVPNYLTEWVGLESYGPAAITSGNSTQAGTHIVFIDTQHKVDIQLASAATIRVHNANTIITVAGNVTLIW
jgi:hypothetical protein